MENAGVNRTSTPIMGGGDRTNEGFMCSECSCLFRKLSHLVRHMAAKHNENCERIKCPVEGCDTEMVRRDHLRRHITRVHKLNPADLLPPPTPHGRSSRITPPVDASGRFKCIFEFCETLISRKDHYYRHIKNIHKADPRQVLSHMYTQRRSRTLEEDCSPNNFSAAVLASSNERKTDDNPENPNVHLLSGKVAPLSMEEISGDDNGNEPSLTEDTTSQIKVEAVEEEEKGEEEQGEDKQDGVEEFMCILCCYSFYSEGGGRDGTASMGRDVTFTKFISDIFEGQLEEESANNYLRKMKSMPVCEECLPLVNQAVNKKLEVDSVEVEVRRRQIELLKQIGRLERKVGEWAKEIGRIEAVVRRTDEERLNGLLRRNSRGRGKSRTKDNNNFTLLVRDRILSVTSKLEVHENRLRSKAGILTTAVTVQPQSSRPKRRKIKIETLESDTDIEVENNEGLDLMADLEKWSAYGGGGSDDDFDLNSVSDRESNHTELSDDLDEEEEPGGKKSLDELEQNLGSENELEHEVEGGKKVLELEETSLEEVGNRAKTTTIAVSSKIKKYKRRPARRVRRKASALKKKKRPTVVIKSGFRSAVNVEERPSRPKRSHVRIESFLESDAVVGVRDKEENLKTYLEDDFEDWKADDVDCGESDDDFDVNQVSDRESNEEDLSDDLDNDDEDVQPVKKKRRSESENEELEAAGTSLEEMDDGVPTLALPSVKKKKAARKIKKEAISSETKPRTVTRPPPKRIKETGKFKCVFDDCDVVVSRSDHLRRHIKRVHKMDPSQVISLKKKQMSESVGQTPPVLLAPPSLKKKKEPPEKRDEGEHTAWKNSFKRRLLRMIQIRVRRQASKASSLTDPDLVPDPRLQASFEYHRETDVFTVGPVVVKLLQEEGFLECGSCFLRECANPWRDPVSRTSVSNRMENHIQTEHLSVFQCPECPSTLRCYTSYSEHVRGHQGKLKCDICDKQFFGEKAVRRHHWMYHMTPEDIAEALRQGQLDPRRPHQSTVDKNNGSHQCDTCGKCFGAWCALNVHRRTHEELEDHVCSNCGKIFKWKGALTYHQNHICFPAGINPPPRLPCAHCSATFKSTVALNNHVLFKHRP